MPVRAVPHHLDSHEQIHTDQDVNAGSGRLRLDDLQAEPSALAGMALELEADEVSIFPDIAQNGTRDAGLADYPG